MEPRLNTEIMAVLGPGSWGSWDRDHGGPGTRIMEVLGSGSWGSYLLLLAALSSAPCQHLETFSVVISKLRSSVSSDLNCVK